jgi:Cu2+-exporting ATPase
MKKNIIKTIILSLLVIMIASCSNGQSEINSENKKQEEVSDKTYYCPMKCEGEKTYEEPGECPVCHMDLEESDTEH